MRDNLSRRRFTLLAAAATSASLAGCSGDDPADDGTTSEDTETESGSGEATIAIDDDAVVSFGAPSDGATAANGVTVEMLAENFTIEESGEINDNAGHFHIMIDEGPAEVGEEIPSDESHLHYGDGSERTVLDLSPGDHELTLQPGDGDHRALPLTDTAEVTVETASVGFAAPADGATVQSPVGFEFETSENLAVEPAGELSQAAGHFHLVVDEPAVEVGEEIPSDESHLHFGDGSSATEVELSEGEHDIVLQMGDGEHLALPATAELSLSVDTPEADRTVTVAPEGSFRFDPESLEVSVGETIEWVWADGGHNVSPGSQPDGGNWSGKDEQFAYDEGTTHRHTFEATGTYEYVCQPHQTSGMVGSVTVTDS